jgi:two-component sensor histidine kinase
MQPWIARLHRTALASRSMPVALRYLITIAIVLAIVWARVHWGAGVQERYPFLVFIPVILACGALLDRGNGFLATALSTVLVDYYLLPPLGSMTVASGEDQAALALFFFTGVLISLVVEALHVGLVDLIMERETAQVAVRDRELLLNELAHRTRNDFANIVTLLNLQSRSAGEDAREALVSAADRVQTIARVHRQLELRDDHVVVDTKSYIGELCADLRLSRLAMRPVAIECIAESHSISLEKAVPLGLIINESITNAAKHAFPDERQGIIKVTFERAGDVYKLTVADNGIGQSGKPRDGGLGNRLVQMLAAQLDSKVEVEPRAPGTAVIVTIVVKTARARAPG